MLKREVQQFPMLKIFNQQILIIFSSSSRSPSTVQHKPIAADLMHFFVLLKSVRTDVGVAHRSIYFWCSECLPSSSPACFIFKSAPVGTTQIIAAAPAAKWTLDLLLHFSLCQSLIQHVLSQIKHLFFKWTPFVPLQKTTSDFVQNDECWALSVLAKDMKSPALAPLKSPLTSSCNFK